MESNKKVMIFGGSYNPIHQGHINAAIMASNYLKVDEVWLMPRKYNYDGSLLLDGKYRVAMINMAIENLPNFKVCDLELKDSKAKLIYTYNSAKIIKRKYPNYDFYFLIGTDQLNSLPRWYNAAKLTKMFKFVCYKRPGYNIDEKVKNDYNVTIIDGPLVDTSSTIIRSGTFQKIDDDIQQYIMEKQLYLKERVMPKLPEERFIHVLSTARFAKKIALSNKVNTNRAYVAGILHDIAKGLTKDEIHSIMEKYFKDKLNCPSYAHHAYVSSYIAYSDFGITDKKILKAIFYHARATKNMSKLDKIIYCADKLEESRPFANTLNDIRMLAYQDIDQCFIKVMEFQLDYLKQSQQKVDDSIIKMIDYYKRRIENGR